MAIDLNSHFERIINGKEKYEFSLLGLNLLFNRLSVTYAANPTPDQMRNCIEEVNQFVSKYQRVVEKDLAKITG